MDILGRVGCCDYCMTLYIKAQMYDVYRKLTCTYCSLYSVAALL